MDAFWIYLISQTFERGRRQQGAPPPQLRIFFPEDVTGRCTDFKNISQRNRRKKKKKKHVQQKWTKKEKKKSQPTGRDTHGGFLLSRKQTNTSLNYRLLSFTGGTFLCFHLLPIVKAVVNIFILSFCVLKLSCKGSCYINV